jgi:hypothetical protein
MSRKIKKDFAFILPHTSESNANGRKTFTNLFDLTISGIGYFDPTEETKETAIDFDIDSAEYKGFEIYPVVQWYSENFENTIKEAAKAHMDYVFAAEIDEIFNEDETGTRRDQDDLDFDLFRDRQNEANNE